MIQVEASEDYVYSIVKSMKEPSGVQYILTYQKFYPGFILNIQAYFDEIGTTGIRDSMVYEQCRRENLVGKRCTRRWTKTGTWPSSSFTAILESTNSSFSVSRYDAAISLRLKEETRRNRHEFER